MAEEDIIPSPKAKKTRKKKLPKPEDEQLLSEESVLDTKSSTAFGQLLQQAVLETTKDVGEKKKKKKKKPTTEQEQILEALRKGDGLQKEEDERVKANIYEPDNSPKNEKSNKRRQKLKEQKESGVDNQAYEKDKTEIIDETPKAKKRVKKKKETKPETDENKEPDKEAGVTSPVASPRSDNVPSASEDVKSPREEKKKKKKKKKSEADTKDEVTEEAEAAEVAKETESAPTTEEKGKDETEVKTEDDSKTSPKKKDKKKKKKQDKPKTEEEEEVKKDIEDKGSVLSVTIHRTDKLKNDFYILHPLVRVHVINEKTGYYLLKQHKDRPVSSYYETENESLSHILPILTQPFDFKQKRSTLPVWEEMLIFNENYNYFVQDDPKVIVFFEILDFVSMNTASSQYNVRKTEGGWHRVAWAFLKIVGVNKKINTGNKVRLQLFYPPAKFSVRQGEVEVFQWWKSNYRDPYPSTLYVTFKEITTPESVEPALRSMFANQQEIGTMSYDELKKTLNWTTKSRENMKKTLSSWTRLAGQVCRVPNKLALTLPAGRKGCFVLKFSHDGRNIACGCHDKEGYPIMIYEVPSGELKGQFTGHFAIIYDLCWSKKDTHLLSASSDGTARIWNLQNFGDDAEKLLPHPSFVYTAQFHPRVDSIVVSGGYDHVLRVWDVHTEDVHGQLLQELEEHKANVNSLCFEEDGLKMYSADGSGNILVWNAFVDDKASRRAFIRDWTLYENISDPDMKGTTINFIKLHPNGRRIMVHCRDNIVRMLDLRVHRIMQKYIGALNFREQIRSTITPCGSFIFSGSEDNFAYAWNTETGDQVAMYSELNYQEPVTDVDFHPRDHMLAVCSLGQNQPVIIYRYDPHIAQMEAGFTPRLPSPTKDLMSTDDELGGTLADTSYGATGTLGGKLGGTGTLVMTKDEFQTYERSRFDKVIKKLNSVSLSASVNAGLAGHPLAVQETPATQSAFGATLDRTFTVATPRSMAMSHTEFSPHATQTLNSSMQQQQFSSQSMYLKQADSGWRPGFSQVGRHGARSSSPTFYGRPPQLSMTASYGKPQFKFQQPAGKSSPRVQKVVALFDYKAQRSDELTIFKGDVVTVLYKDNENWWMGELSDGQQGFFPANYVAEEDKYDEQQQIIDDSSQDERRKRVSAVNTRGGDVRFFSGTEESEEEILSSRRFRKKKGKKVHIDSTLNDSHA